MEEPRRSTRSPHSDESLAHRVAQGDDGAFDELRDRYGRGLSQYASRLVGDLELGEDIARVGHAVCGVDRAHTEPILPRPSEPVQIQHTQESLPKLREQSSIRGSTRSTQLDALRTSRSRIPLDRRDLEHARASKAT